MQKNSSAAEETNKKIEELVRKKRKGQADRQAHHQEKATKFIVEYKDENKEVVSRWHYDLKKQPYGPVMVEEIEKPIPKKSKIK